MGIYKKLIQVVIVSIIGYLIWVFATGYEEFLAGFSSIGFTGLAILLLLSLFNYLTRFLRWHWMINKVNPTKIDIVYHCKIYLAGFALTATPGKVGEAVRSYYLKPEGVPVNSSLAALLAERMLDILSVLIISILAIIHFTEYRWVGISILVGILLLILIIRSQFIIKVLEAGLKISGSSFLQKVLRLSIDTITSTRSYMTLDVWFFGLLIGLVSWGAEAYGFYLLLKWLTGADLILLASGIYSFSMIIGAVSFLPGGLGGAEVTMAGLLTLIGISLSDATTATIICRLVTLWFAVILGLYYLSRLKMPEQMEEINE